MIKNFKLLNNKTVFYFNDNKFETFPNIWLRDHIKNKENWDFKTNQRITYTANLDINIKVKKAKLLKKGKFIEILWSDENKPTKYSYEFLKKNSLKKEETKSDTQFWKDKDIKDQIFINYKQLQTKVGFKNLLKKIHIYGFAVVKNCSKNLNSVENIAKKIGYVRNSIFGGLWTFESNNKKADSAYSNQELRPHTDSTYSNDAPGLQLLLCCKYDAKGGDSIMVDGFKLANEIKQKYKKHFKTLTNTKVKGSYIGDGVRLEAKRPIIKLNEKNNFDQISFNNYDRAPFRETNQKTINFYKAIKVFDTMANQKQYQWRHILKPGELLIFNNWRVMHGRGAFSGIRKMAGCYINKEDFDSCCRMNNICLLYTSPSPRDAS